MPSLKLSPSACANTYVFLQPIYFCGSAFPPGKAFKIPSSWSSGLPLFPNTDPTTHISFMPRPGLPGRIVLFQSIDNIGVFCYNMTLSVYVAGSWCIYSDGRWKIFCDGTEKLQKKLHLVHAVCDASGEVSLGQCSSTIAFMFYCKSGSVGSNLVRTVSENRRLILWVTAYVKSWAALPTWL